MNQKDMFLKYGYCYFPEDFHDDGFMGQTPEQQEIRDNYSYIYTTGGCFLYAMMVHEKTGLPLYEFGDCEHIAVKTEIFGIPAFLDVDGYFIQDIISRKVFSAKPEDCKPISLEELKQKIQEGKFRYTKMYCDEEIKKAEKIFEILQPEFSDKPTFKI